MVFWETLLISCIPSIVTGIVTFVGMKIQVNTTIRQLKMTNEHELEKLMEQHKVDIESIREEHRLELELKEKEHQYKLEIIQQEHENEIIRKEQELENTAKYNAASSIMTGLINGVIGGAINSNEVQSQLGYKITEALKNDTTNNS